MQRFARMGCWRCARFIAFCGLLCLFFGCATSTSDWKVYNGTVRRPYEETQIMIVGVPGIEGMNWQLSGHTKIDNKEIGNEPQRGHLDIQGWGNSQGHGIQLVISWFPVFQFPKSLGEHSIDLLFSTNKGKYHFRRFTLLLDVTKEEREQLETFEESGANVFLNDPYGFTPSDSKEKKSMPYAAVLAFVEQYPGSYLTKPIESRIKLIWLWDVNGRGVKADERLWLGKILGAIDKKRFVAEFQNHVKSTSRPDVSKLWLDAVEAYQHGQ